MLRAKSKYKKKDDLNIATSQNLNAILFVPSHSPPLSGPRVAVFVVKISVQIVTMIFELIVAASVTLLGRLLAFSGKDESP